MNLYKLLDGFEITHVNNINVGDYVIDLDFYHLDSSLPFSFLQIISIDEEMNSYLARYCGQVSYLIGNIEPKPSAYIEEKTYSIGNDFQVVVPDKYRNYINKVLIFS